MTTNLNMQILEIRPEQVVVYMKDTNTLTTRPNSSYYSLKYFGYDSGIISHTFSDTCYVRETFDERIFNCWCDGLKLQLRQDLSEKLSMAIKLNSLEDYKELFNQAYTEEPAWNILKIYLQNIDGVVKTKEGFVIYESFLIDFKGNANVLRSMSNRDIIAGEETRTWQSICIVMRGGDIGYRSKAVESNLPDEYGKMQLVNSITMTILAKIIFLLKPNLEDKVFTDQLSKKLLDWLSKLKK